ncbi:hypothetical protein DCE79_12030 [Lysinibacillus sp. 2017]|uniref:hypothetical protein n=1 Tax=unclassified Lysinibacillus TaxID=2636778 RepID=UPI000D52661E|nr:MULTISPECIES: hypothetical protein [unclassified Lysinibacillus]AWE08070.1 hypothetical protein DCE79_12030 [Lysinibacillus sp. 2017]TGN36425.1 hypothetical protein E4L99_05910 [Lysinibacillus sp. S2017]
MFKVKKEVYRIKKGKITLIGTIVILFVLAFLFIYNISTKGEIPESPPSISPELNAENEKKIKESEEITTLLYQKGGLFEQVNNKLKNNGYSFQMMLAVYSNDDIRVKYILEKDATESIQKEVKSIFFETVENVSLDSKSFNLKVVDRNDGPDW